MTLNDKLNIISTIIQTDYTNQSSQGTGFFYQVLGEEKNDGDNGDKKGVWRDIKELWLITNKHVVCKTDINGNITLPERLSFNLRKIDGSNVKWHSIHLSKTELQQRVKIHTNTNVDIAAISILDLVNNAIADTSNNIIGFSAVSEENLPGKNMIDVEVCDDAVTIGYPKGFYDTLNLFPIVKSGIIASRWGANFNGLPYVLIDAKLFPGSSGSLVISKPINQLISNNKIFTSTEKQFAFLGVYSGEPFRQSTPIEFDDFTIVRKDGFNLGVVWYSYLIPEILNTGRQI